MNDHEAFMRTICASPDEDLPRLVYADWLEENRYEPLADFIRVQLELSRMGHQRMSICMLSRDRDRQFKLPAGTDPDTATLLIRETELFEHRVEWRRLPPNWIEQHIGLYRRGFLETWRGTVRDFLKYRDELWTYGPIRKLDLSGKDGDFVALADDPLLTRIEVLRLSPNSVLDRGGIAIAHSKSCDRLKEIEVYLYGKRISDEASRDLDQRFGDHLKIAGR